MCRICPYNRQWFFRDGTGRRGSGPWRRRLREETLCAGETGISCQEGTRSTGMTFTLEMNGQVFKIPPQRYESFDLVFWFAELLFSAVSVASVVGLIRQPRIK